MFRFVKLCFGTLVRLLRGRRGLLLENLALRQQLAVLKRRHPRPSLGLFDKLFWAVARRVWSAWRHSLIIVTPESVVRWHRAGFRLYCRLISKARTRVGRRTTPKEVLELIFRMVAQNPTWRARASMSKSRKISNRWPVAPFESPSSMAFDADSMSRRCARGDSRF